MYNKILSAIFFVVWCCNASIAYSESMSMPTVLRESLQLMVVITTSWQSNRGQLQQFSRGTASDSWKKVGTSRAVLLGKDGLGWAADLRRYHLSGPIKSELDDRSPAGVFTLDTAFGFKAKPEQIKLPYLTLTPSTLCIFDSNSKYYGRIINKNTVSHPDWDPTLVEQMRSYDPDYRLGIVINYNLNGNIKKGGSCIFIHILGNDSAQGTLGCTAMSAPNMIDLLQWLKTKSQPVLVQLPKSEYSKYQHAWRLPNLS